MVEKLCLIASIALAIVGLNEDIAQNAFERERWEQEQTRQIQEAVPRISFVAGSYRFGKSAVLTYQNISPASQANIMGVTFRVTEPATLEQIARIDPRPAEPYLIGSQNPVDSVHFTDGFWTPAGYEFSIRVGLHIPPGKSNDLSLAVVNPRLRRALDRLTGELAVEYGGNEPCRLWNVTVPVRAW